MAFEQKIVIDIDDSIASPIDYQSISTQVNGVIIKAGERNNNKITINKYFADHIKGFMETVAGETGVLKLGMYFVSQAISEEEAINEANAMLNLETKMNNIYPDCISFPIYIYSGKYGTTDDKSRGDKIDRTTRDKTIAAFFNTIRSHNLDCGLFTTNKWINDSKSIDLNDIKNRLNSTNKDLNLWVAKYSTEKPKDNYVGWKKTSSVTYGSINVGRSIFIKNIAGWQDTALDISENFKIRLFQYGSPLELTGDPGYLYYGNMDFENSLYFKIYSIIGEINDYIVELDLNNDCDISITNNHNSSYDYTVGPTKYTPMIITVTGKGEFTGQLTMEVPIHQTPLGISQYPYIDDKGKQQIAMLQFINISLERQKFDYTGNYITPKPVLNFLPEWSENYETPIPESDYNVEYTDNINIGTGQCIITPGGGHGTPQNLRGIDSMYFIINPINIETSSLQLPNGLKYKYTGDPIEPTTFISGFERNYFYHRGWIYYYNTTYYNNINVGIGRVTCNGIAPNVLGTLSTTFRISYYDVSKFDWELNPPEAIYTGKQIIPKIIISGVDSDAVEGIDYEMLYEGDLIEAGNYQITLIGKGEYIGTSSKTFVIKPISIFSYNIDLKDPLEIFLYDATFKTPDIIVSNDSGNELIKDVDYVVTYENNKIPGTASIIVTGINNYSGTITTNFKIENNYIENCYAKFGHPTIWSLFRVQDGTFNLFANKECTLKLEYDFDYEITDIDMFVKDDFEVVSIDVLGKNYIIGSDTFYFRIIEEEPPIPDLSDDGVYNFGCLNLQDETAVGGYSFGDPNGESVSYPDENVKDGEDYDMDILSCMNIAHYDEDNGRNIDRRGNAIDDAYQRPEKVDDGTYNYGDIDINDESANGDYDFTDIDLGTDPDNISSGDYDFNKLSGDLEDWFEPGIDYRLTGIPFYSTYSRNVSFDIRYGTYFIYNSIIRNNRIRMCRENNDIEKPCSSTGWVNVDDILNLNRIAVGDYVHVYGKVYENASGIGNYIMMNGETMYIKGILNEADNIDNIYIVSESYNSPQLGYTSKASIVSTEKEIN